ncbi:MULTISPECIES: PaaX family transcriptional regulator [unclassified Paracoccus (in: a-proteobacteria)]|uniref:PaaX family transcriptional regulator n=1 Tax=unclassified Paracoccus (in: a-proteobacteria) TaxID=2688777 RepID=UPI0012B2F107|nr:MULTISPECIES: PaaX family transcriptional regulator C-terminal domain-containing protein [unclassified Paracoccus (in: a-proteobacteria)]UXU76574.1 PaaX family transcriptional regulator [Paracoccus sp. SMMA_5]UXU82461.1 PaaX family transcriptional regulator [Paracoccus sp. SMMA_5_TC]
MTMTSPITDILGGLELRAAAFIVTIYGDVALPRGGVLWTGTLIDVCACVGINESLVRTAISRLVAAQRLRGERVGRRSYYRLDAAAQREFDQAARLLYAPDIAPRGWQILHAPDLAEEEVRNLRLGRMGGGVYLRPDRDQTLPAGATLFRAGDPQPLSQVAQFWDLSLLNGRYQDMLRRFGPLAWQLREPGMTPQDALVARLLLVHVYRAVLLRDPRLPTAALPPDWQGTAARDLFQRLYLGLTPAADSHIANNFQGVDGLLPQETPASRARLAGLTSG